MGYGIWDMGYGIWDMGYGIGHKLLISTLMTNGADTARRGIHDMFPLHLAVLFGFSDCCRKLLSSGQLYSIVSSLSNEHVLSAGFDINTPDGLGRTCLHAAASGGWDMGTPG
ncbi:serine/threonine-protein phosphatase 6 regulatory ankyrin repeat subunit C-like [Malurus melanocephalus]|uniref:serine/threonine-protein phosphatase 6 regulatory ankyrin repeat subunit C-like n=1 Tax=Malurus melanocephalus TaxID=175006 RepID=UPI00254747AA|nr:serine/threonine-protein phosphatase 6 regulatory ankyrin repeat subunit C-like [Malurus melanocephalus]